MKTKTKLQFKTKSVAIGVMTLFFVLLPIMGNNNNIVIAADLHYQDLQITPAEMVNLTNQAREEKGLVALVVSQELTIAAEAKAGDMFQFQYFEHNSPSGITPWDWIKSAGYDYRYAGENLAIDFITASGAHQALMASDSHRENILNQNYTEIGVAARKGIFEESESSIIVMEFGAPLEARVVYASESSLDKNNELAGSVKLDDEIIYKTDNLLEFSSIDRLQEDENKIIITNNLEKNTEKKLVEKIEEASSFENSSDSQEHKFQNNWENEKKNVVFLKNENKLREVENSKKIANNLKAVWLFNISAQNVEKINLSKVYTENIYWKSDLQKNKNHFVAVLGVSKQRQSGFSLTIFYFCVLAILLMFELLYLFSNFITGKALETIRTDYD